MSGIFKRLSFARETLSDYRALEQPAQDNGRLSPRFATVADSGFLYGVQSIDEAMTLYSTGGRISRREAITVPAVKAARDKIAALGQLPLQLLDANQKTTEWSLLSQPEDDRTANETWTGVVDDLLFYGVAYLRITHTGWHGKPVQVVRLDPSTVTKQPDHKTYYSATGSGSAWVHVPDSQLIRIGSPNDPLLVAGARAIRALGRLEVAALNAAEGVPPVDYFTPAEGADPADDEAIADFLTDWATARQSRTTGYVPAALNYNNNGFNPEQLQLQSAREMAIGEIARLTGVDATELGLSVSSTTYFNAQDRDRVLLRNVIGPYMRAIEAALSREQVTPRGYRVRFDVSEFVKPDGMTAAQTDEVLVRSGVMTINEVRARRGLEPLAEAPQESINTEVNENV